MNTFTGALLCGGRSSRMGRDKALIEIDGRPLWHIQLTKLQAVCGEVIVCGSRSQQALFQTESVPFAPDATADLGPLSGMARALESTQRSHVLVLAVDMPKMSERYLQGLCDAAQKHCGVVPERAGRLESLCAVYPVDLLPWVISLLSGNDRSLRSLIRIALQKRLMRPFPVPDSDLELFENWNAPADISPLGPRSPSTASPSPFPIHLPPS